MDTNDLFNEHFDAKQWFSKTLEDMDLESFNFEIMNEDSTNYLAKSDDYILKNLDSTLSKIISFQNEQLETLDTHSSDIVKVLNEDIPNKHSKIDDVNKYSSLLNNNTSGDSSLNSTNLEYEL